MGGRGIEGGPLSAVAPHRVRGFPPIRDEAVNGWGTQRPPTRKKAGPSTPFAALRSLGRKRSLAALRSLRMTAVVVRAGWQRFDCARQRVVIVLCCACVNRRSSSENAGATPLGGGAGDALADGDCVFCAAGDGLEIVVSHPRFYWGETGNVNMRPLFTIPIPASRDTVPTGYGYMMPDQNGWSRYLHFQAAWVLVLTALVYGILEPGDAGTCAGTCCRRGASGAGARCGA